MNTEWYAWHQRPQRSQRPNDRPGGGHKPGPTHPQPEKAPMPEEVIASWRLEIERKAFVFYLKENVRGRLLRITEASPTYSNTIIIPASGLGEFKALLEECLKQSEQTPPLCPE